MDVAQTKFGRRVVKNSVERTPQHAKEDIGTGGPRLIFSCSVAELSGKCLDITPCASPCQFRMLSCLSLEHKGLLEIFEFDKLPLGEYCAVSYVWKGVPVTTHSDSGTFTVRSAEDGDPISIDVLRDIVWVAGEEGRKYLWLDRISIIQSDRNDKAWQIIRMFNIYEKSRCIIVPGGLGRLASSDEHTSWMDRAWTLQEALAPDRDDVVVLYSHNSSLEFEKHVSELPFIYTREKPLRSDRTTVPAAYVTLDDVLTVVGYSVHQPFGFKQAHCQPLIRASAGKDGWRQAVWQSALMRTSSRPVDMIFSIMHFFGILLSPKDFETDDRLGATIKFAQAILAESRKGTLSDWDNWMCALYFMETSQEISTFPQFPETSIDGGALVRTRDGTKRVVTDIIGDSFIKHTKAPLYPNFLAKKANIGEMDDSGYYHFTSNYSLPLKFIDSHSPATNYPWEYDSQETGWEGSHNIIAADGTEWRPIKNTLSGSSSVDQIPEIDAWGVYLGTHIWLDVFMLIKRHGEGIFHRVTYFSLTRDVLGENLISEDASQQTWFPYAFHAIDFSIGGPDSLIPRPGSLH